jgi:hypothetical protein
MNGRHAPSLGYTVNLAKKKFVMFKEFLVAITVTHVLFTGTVIIQSAKWRGVNAKVNR